jgi:hypothetical protein
MKQRSLLLATLLVSISAINAQTNVFPTDGNVGIGTTNPSEKLEIFNSNTTPGVLSLQSSRNDAMNVDVGRICAKQSTIEIARIGMQRLDGTNTGALTFWTKETNNTDLSEKVRIDGNGNVGIGTTSPQAKLDIENNILLCSGDPAWGVRIKANFPNYNGGWSRGFFVVNQDNSSNFIGLGAVGICSNGIAMMARAWIGTDYNNSYMNFLANGSVGIGTTAPDQKLTVKGKIHAEEVIVDLNVPVADYVFAKDYVLMPLHKVEQYVQQNSHLPDIPSATEIKEQGLSMGEMQNKLLKKIEELTLYAIEQNKKIEKLENEIKASPQPLSTREGRNNLKLSFV